MPTSCWMLLELDLHLLAELEVERAERLVEQQHLRPVDDRARERDALALAAGELARLARRRSRRGAPSRAPPRRARAPLGLGDLLDAQPVLDVLLHGHVREQRVVLEDRVDVARERRLLGDVLAAQQTSPASGSSKPAISRSVVVLPEPRRAEQGEELALFDGQVDAVDRGDVAVALRQPAQDDVVRLGVGWRCFRLHFGGPRHRRHGCGATVTAQPLSSTSQVPVKCWTRRTTRRSRTLA